MREDRRHRQPTKDFVIIIKHPSSKIGFEFTHKTGEGLILSSSEIQVAEIRIVIIKARGNAHGKYTFANRILDYKGIVAEDAGVGITSNAVNRCEKAHSHLALVK